MSLVDNIRKDWIEARKNQSKSKATLLGTLIGAMQTKEKTFSPARSLTEAEVIGEVNKILSGVRENIELVRKNYPNDTTKLTVLEQEETILACYIPSQLSDDDLRLVIIKKKEDGKDLKTIMTELKAEYAGRYDGKKAAEIAKT